MPGSKAKRAANLGVIYLRHIDPALKRAYKAACARRGLTMTEAVRQHMLAKVQEEEPNAVKHIRANERKL